MSLNAYAKFDPTVGGRKLESSNKQAGREKLLPIIQCNHEIISPRDPASGLPTGKRQHKPFTILCELDKTWPVFQDCLTKNDTIKKIEFSFWANRVIDKVASAKGTEVHVYSIELINATVCQTELIMLNNKNPDLMRYETACRIAFTYQKITWMWKEGGITAMDDWEAPVS